MTTPPVNPHLVAAPWTGHVPTDVALCPAWAREAVEAMTLPTRGNVFAAVNVRYAALVCMCRGGDRAAGVVFAPVRGGMAVYKPRDPGLLPHWDETWRLLMALYLKHFAPNLTPPAPDTRLAADDTTRPMRRPDPC